jgi:hypothetical protein
MMFILVSTALKIKLNNYAYANKTFKKQSLKQATNLINLNNLSNN